MVVLLITSHTAHLQAFLEATLRISMTKMHLIHQVIPYIDLLTTHLEKAVADWSLMKPVRSSAARGLRMLNKYYSRTDDSIMYRIAMSMLLLSHMRLSSNS